MSGMIVSLFIVFCLVTSDSVLSRFDSIYAGYYIGWSRPLLCVVLGCIAVFFTATGGDNYINKLFVFLLYPILGE